MSLSGLSRRLLLVALAIPLSAQAEEPTERTLSPYFLVKGDDAETDRLPLLGTTVTVNVAGVIADVTVQQTYKNDGLRPIHARYVFPASTRAAVHGLSMILGDEIVYAKIKEREEAKQEFTAAKQAGKNAALLEQQRPNVFTMDVANITPGQHIEVELRYTELLVPTAGVYEFVYPAVVGPRHSGIPVAGAGATDPWLTTPSTREHEPPRHSLSLAGTLSAGMPIRELASPSHAIVTHGGDPSLVQFSLDPTEGQGGDRDFVLRYRLDGDQIQSGLMLYQGQDENFFLMMVQPPRRVEIEQIPPREYVFVVDVSGSMHGFPLDTTKVLLRDLIGHLRPTDTFNVLLFSGDSHLWSPSSNAATRANIDDAVATIDQQTGGGGTELLEAVKRAMTLPREEGLRSRSLIVVTDGYIAAEKEVFAYIRENLGEANVFAFGIGSGVNRHLIEGIARAGLGEPFVVLSLDEAEEMATRFREYVEYPLLTDVHVAFEGFETYDVQPASIPDVMAERPIVVQGKWRGEPRGWAVVSGATGAGSFTKEFNVLDIEPADSNVALRHLWARARIADLSAGDTTEEEKRQIVQLGLTYSLLTRYTSFVAVHEVIRNPAGVGEDVVPALPLPAGVSDNTIGMASGSEPRLLWLFAPALLALLVVAMRRRLSVARAWPR